MTDRSVVIAAIRSSWSAETCAHETWGEDNPARGQCEPSSFVAWRYLGGDLVLASVLVDGEQVEHHYWNRIDGEDIDLTREQFVNGEVVEEIQVLPDEFLAANMSTMKPVMLRRISVLSERVASIVGEEPPRP